MKELFGGPGKVSGLVLRMGQCVFGVASIAVMASSHGFATCTAFCYLIASMGLQVIWSFSLACMDIHALRLKRDLRNHIYLSLLVVGDWVTGILSLAAACSSAGVVVLIIKDTNMCKANPKLSCHMFQISVALAFLSWFFLAISSFVMFWLAASD
ncbi:CASP-like protein 5B1 [Capsicum annuum]|uniref:CASP-like protein 5B1 isoform X1 n=1 Tax=Capsicum annuum TaxID=4072 RepID=UPI0007BF5A62|nr:CASP-like protein 5B1 isoform X1 [Capsicum annuum]KAF3673278.1 CASP-like protein 5B1 [Capsicum annuum]